MVIFGRIVWEIVFFIKDILCKIIKELMILEVSFISIEVIKVYCRNW